MFDMTDSIVASGERNLHLQTLYRSASALDQHPRTDAQTMALKQQLTGDLFAIGVSTESLLSFLSDKLTGLFGAGTTAPAPDATQLLASVKAFRQEVHQTFANQRWVYARIVKDKDQPLQLGAYTREWMVGSDVVTDLEVYLPAILKGLQGDLNRHGDKAATYLFEVRKFEQGLYTLPAAQAYELGRAFIKKHALPEAPAPFAGPYLGNYKVSKVGGWWSIDTHPKTPLLPKEITRLTNTECLRAGEQLVDLLDWGISITAQLEKLNLTLTTREAIYTNDTKRLWWDRLADELGKFRANELFQIVDAQLVLPQVTGLLTMYPNLAWKYARAHYERMNRSLMSK